MNIQLSEHFTYEKLLRFVFPSIIMMIFTSVYSVVDGLFVSNYVGKIPFAAVNLIMPPLMILGALGFMIGTGGSAIVAKTLGEGKSEEAKRYFSMLVYVTVIGGIVLTVMGLLCIRSVSIALGAEGEMIEYCVLYGRILLISLTAFMLQNVFQSFFVTAEKPQLGLAVTVAAGISNIILDFVFIAVFKWGLAGAAIATSISQMIGGIFPFLYFLRKNETALQLVKTGLDKSILFKTCTNGSSELASNISMSLVNMLYNYQLIKAAGEDGVAAYGVIMYVNFIFIAIFLGYSIGSAPIVSYHYGAGNHSELKNLFQKSLIFIGGSSLVMTVFAILSSGLLSGIFVGYDRELYTMTRHGFCLFSLSFLVSGWNIFASAFFTSLNNGMVSALISFLRAFVFQIIMVLLLPAIWGINGIWLAALAAEMLALVVTVYFLVIKRKTYHYI
ncbi:MAG: MATE family efflux transporter [Lachnospiraceae bacterium]|nr:MATE family efflux transporter [Lachnospiraceae bacterium]